MFTATIARHQVLIWSIDGFRWDYTNKTNTPNFDAFTEAGVKAEYLIPTFPTLTFPSHYSLATGLYSEDHGIVGNGMFDPLFNARFYMSTTDSRWWDQALPFWTRAVLQGRTAGISFWTGCSVKLGGVYPTSFRRYNGSVTNEQRIDTVVDWLGRGYDVVALYMESVDSAGHKYGPDSAGLINAVEEVDRLLGYLVERLSFDGPSATDVILVSDHGMSDIDTSKRLVNVSRCTDVRRIRYGHSGIVVNIFPRREEDLDTIYNDLRSCSDHMRVYKRLDVPERLHYSHNRRIGPIVLIAEEGWYIAYTNYRSRKKGNHGYDNAVANMRAIFMARGPSFVSGLSRGPINAVDVYPLLCELLDITPGPHNGSLSSISDMLNRGTRVGQGGFVMAVAASFVASMLY